MASEQIHGELGGPWNLYLGTPSMMPAAMTLGPGEQGRQGSLRPSMEWMEDSCRGLSDDNYYSKSQTPCTSPDVFPRDHHQRPRVLSIPRCPGYRLEIYWHLGTQRTVNMYIPTVFNTTDGRLQQPHTCIRPMENPCLLYSLPGISSTS